MVKADPYVQDAKQCDGLVKLTYLCSFIPSWTLFTGMTLLVKGRSCHFGTKKTISKCCS